MVPSWRVITLRVLVILRSTTGSVKLLISSPKNGAVLDIAAGRTNGGIDLDVSVSVETQVEYIRDVDGRVICLYINGSIFATDINCVAVTSAQGFVLPSTIWQAGRAWLHVELFPSG